MNRRGRLSGAVLALCLGLLASACGSDSEPSAPANDEPTKVRLILDFLPTANHAIWYLGQENGFFEEAGIDLEILPGESFSVAMSTVVAGQADIGLTDLTSLTLAKADDPDLAARMVAGLEPRSWITIYSLEGGADLASPGDLSGAELGVGSTSNLDEIVTAWAEDQGVSDIRFKDADPANLVSLLFAGRLPAIVQNILNQDLLAGIADKSGEDLVTLDLADHGMPDFYSGVLVAADDFAQGNPEAVEAFLDATQQSIEYTLANLDEATALLQERFPTLEPEPSRARLEAWEILLTRGGEIPLSDAVGIDEGIVASTVEFLDRSLGLDAAIDSEDLYTTEFLD